ncbi:hypothetical protein QE152_g27252 [Popillia japonica]|uniref:Uncharacterized protein n=1 Tax=Popillia japonica TaxID=7064 RepID=A0AAW1JVY1_POPJA
MVNHPPGINEKVIRVQTRIRSFRKSTIRHESNNRVRPCDHDNNQTGAFTIQCQYWFDTFTGDMREITPLSELRSRLE